jgi:hypothetical protein
MDLTVVKGGRYAEMSPRRWSRDAEQQSDRVRKRPRREPLSPAKQRVAESLAALLVAHYRRRHQARDSKTERTPVA